VLQPVELVVLMEPQEPALVQQLVVAPLQASAQLMVMADAWVLALPAALLLFQRGAGPAADHGCAALAPADPPGRSLR
jgi:hypothetical protein